MKFLNEHKIKSTWNQLDKRPDPENEHLEDEPSAVRVWGLWAMSVVATLGLVVALLPHYRSNYDSKVDSLKRYPHYYAIHGLVLAQLGIGLAWLLFLVSLAARPGVVAAEVAWSDDKSFKELYWAFSGSNYTFRQQMAIILGDAKEPGDETDISDDEWYLPMDSVNDYSEGASMPPRLSKGEMTYTLGATQSGKSSTIKTLASQLTYDRNTAVVAHGSKGEYKEFFESLGLDVLTIRSHKGSATWNMFEEIPDDLPDSLKENRFREIAQTMVPAGESNNPHFPKSAQNIFAALCMAVYRDEENPTHADLRALFSDASLDYIENLLESHGEASLAGQIQDKDGNAADEWTTLMTACKRYFAGDFAAEGSFSFREYFENPAGRAVVIETPESIGGLGEMFATIVDMSIKAMLESKGTTTYLVLDEIDTIGAINKLTDAGARGLKQDSRLIVGVQSRSQMIDKYGENTTKGIEDNMNQSIVVSPGSNDIDAVQDFIGERTELAKTSNMGVNVGKSPSTNLSRSKSEQRRAPISESKIANWDTGEGLIVGRSEWWKGQISHPDEAIPVLKETRGSVLSESSGRAAGGDESDQDVWGGESRRSRDELSSDDPHDLIDFD